MEGLTKRAWMTGGVLLLAGLAFNMAPKVQYESKSEGWMEEVAPPTVDSLSFEPHSDNPGYTYRMNKMTYDELKPYGIVARVYKDQARTYDVVLIASRDKESFHDPRVCFTAQGWTLKEQKQVMVKTQTRGDVPVTLAKMSGPQPDRFAVFFYRGPGGFYPTPVLLKANLAWQQFLWRSDIDGVFYRFMPLHEGATEEELLEFIGKYLEESKVKSGGYF